MMPAIWVDQGKDEDVQTLDNGANLVGGERFASINQASSPGKSFQNVGGEIDADFTGTPLPGVHAAYEQDPILGAGSAGTDPKGVAGPALVSVAGQGDE
jgi:hypothetical protein